MIFDSSIWIHFLKRTDVKPAILLRDKLLQNESVFICPPIVQEVLQGIRDDQLFAELKGLMLSLELSAINELSGAIGAAGIYRTLRKKGITIRKPNDCLIAWYAMHFNLILVHDDKDFELIGAHTSLKTYREN